MSFSLTTSCSPVRCEYCSSPSILSYFPAACTCPPRAVQRVKEPRGANGLPPCAFHEWLAVGATTSFFASRLPGALPGARRTMLLRSSRKVETDAAPPSPPAPLPKRARGDSLRHLPNGHPQHVAEAFLGGEHGRGLEAAMRQAVLAARIAAGAELAPVGRVDQLAVGLVMGVAEQIAGAAPAADVVGRVRPGGARQFPLRRGETPCRSARPSAGSASASPGRRGTSRGPRRGS